MYSITLNLNAIKYMPVCPMLKHKLFRALLAPRRGFSAEPDEWIHSRGLPAAWKFMGDHEKA